MAISKGQYNLDNLTENILKYLLEQWQHTLSPVLGQFTTSFTYVSVNLVVEIVELEKPN